MVKISVIVPCYNQEKYIRECLESVLKQTFSDYEVIVVNDGSTDSSLSIIQSYTDKYDNFHLINQQNQGVVSARNNAIKQAQGIYIYPLDADDKIAPTCLEVLFNIIKQGLFDVVYSQTNFFGAKNGCFELPLPDKVNMYQQNRVVCSALYRKSDWEKYGGYDENMKNGLEDWEFWLNFIEDGKEFYRVDDALFFYRVHNKSRNRGIDKSIAMQLYSYVRGKHKKLGETVVKSGIPLVKKFYLLIVKSFLSKKKYKKKENKCRRYLFDFKEKPQKVVMTLLVKNEEDILEKNLIFHKAMGVDGFIVTDNLSDDNTGNIIKKYMEKGWILECIEERSQDYCQADWVHRMAILARKKYNADWIINADADEFWFPKGGNIKECLHVQNSKFFVPIYNMLSENDDWQYNIHKVVNNFSDKMTDRLKKEGRLSQFSQFSVSIPKVIVRACEYKMIHLGNHNCDVIHEGKKIISPDIQIYHFNIRGMEHFKRKMIVGGAAYERNMKLGKEIEAHWRFFYEGYKKGYLNLDEEYLKSNGSLIKEEIQKYGVVETDTTIKDFFESEKVNG